MIECLIFLAGIWLLVEGLRRNAGFFFALASVLFFVSATSSIHTTTEHLVVNGTIQTLEQTTFNYPILYASWGLVILSLVLLIISLIRRV